MSLADLFAPAPKTPTAARPVRLSAPARTPEQIAAAAAYARSFVRNPGRKPLPDSAERRRESRRRAEQRRRDRLKAARG